MNSNRMHLKRLLPVALVAVGISVLCIFPALAVDWTPAWLPSTELWLDAMDTNTVIRSGNLVTTWQDKSENDRHATQGTPADQPIFNPTNFLGLPTLTFSSTDKLIASIQTNTFPTGITVFVVLKKYAYAYGDSHPFLRLKSGKAAPFRGRWDNVSGGYWNYRYVGNGSAEGSFGRFNNFPATNTPLLLSIAISTNTYTEMYNAAQAWSGAHGGAYEDTASDVIIGNNSGTGYSISEVVVTDSLSTTNRVTMEGYLAWKWTMQDNLPGGHPFKDFAPQAPPPAGMVLIFQ